MNHIIEFIYIAVAYGVAPILAMLAVLYSFRKYKLTRRQKMYLVVSAYVAMLASYGVTPLFAPLGYVAQFVVLFAASQLIAKLPVRMGLLFALANVAAWYLFLMTLLFLFGLFVVMFQPVPTNP